MPSALRRTRSQTPPIFRPCPELTDRLGDRGTPVQQSVHERKQRGVLDAQDLVDHGLVHLEECDELFELEVAAFARERSGHVEAYPPARRVGNSPSAEWSRKSWSATSTRCAPEDARNLRARVSIRSDSQCGPGRWRHQLSGERMGR